MKTISLKKVSAVAVASLGFGLLSVVPASAVQTLIAVNDIEMTGTGSSGAYVLSGAASIANTATVTTATPVAYGWGITDPSGNVSYIGTDFANATVGTVSAVASKASTLTFATGFLAQTGKWSISIVSEDADATELNTQAEIVTAIAATSESEDIFVYKTTPSYTGGTGRTVTSATAIAQTLNGVVTANIVSDDTSASYVVTTSGVGTLTSAFANNAGYASSALTSTTGDTVTNNNGTNASGGVTWTPAVAKKSFIQVKTSSAVAGSQTISVTPLNASGTPGTPVTATITWGATPVISASTSGATAYVLAGTSVSGSADASIVVAKTAATKAGNIIMRINDQDGNPLYGQVVSATISGPGLVEIDCDSSYGDETGLARTDSATCSSSENYITVGINADGTSGVGVVTVAVGSTTLTTKSVSFYDSPATVEAKQNHKVLSSAGAAAGIAAAASAGTGADIANTPAVILTVKDKNGILIPGLTAAASSVTAVASDTTVLSETITMAQNDGSGAANTAKGTYNVQVTSVAKASGSTATLKFRVVVSASAGTFVESAPLTYTLGGSVASVALSLDKSSYTQGEAASATLTLKDSSGNAARDGDHSDILTGALTSSLPITSTLSYNATATTVSSLGGVAVKKFNAPAIGGAWTVTGTTGTGPATTAEKGKALTASATIADPNAGLLTQIDALNAKIVALNALIAKIMKKLGVK